MGQGWIIVAFHSFFVWMQRPCTIGLMGKLNKRRNIMGTKTRGQQGVKKKWSKGDEDGKIFGEELKLDSSKDSFSPMDRKNIRMAKDGDQY